MSKDRIMVAARVSPNVVGAWWMFLSAITFTLMTSLIKFLGGDYPATVQTFYRQLAGTVVLLPLMVRHGRAAFVTERLGLILFRAVATVGGFILTFESFRLLPLADANAISFTRVLWVVPIAVFFLRERVGPLRLSATIMGFAGILVMMPPEAGGGIGWPQLAALGGALLLAFANVSAKSMTASHGTLTLLVWASLLGLVLSLPPALAEWRWPSPRDLFLLSAMGVAGVLNQYCSLAGLKSGDATAVIPVDYSRLVMAAAVGFVFFNEMPQFSTVMGAAIIVGSTLFIVWREQQAGRKLT